MSPTATAPRLASSPWAARLHVLLLHRPALHPSGLPLLRPPRFQLLVRPCLVLTASDLGFSTRQHGGQPSVHIHPPRVLPGSTAAQTRGCLPPPPPPSSTRLRSTIPTLRNLQHCWAPLCFSWSFPPSSLQGVLKQAPVSSTEEEARHAHLSPPGPHGGRRARPPSSVLGQRPPRPGLTLHPVLTSSPSHSPEGSCPRSDALPLSSAPSPPWRFPAPSQPVPTIPTASRRSPTL